MTPTSYGGLIKQRLNFSMYVNPTVGDTVLEVTLPGNSLLLNFTTLIGSGFYERTESE